jgi:hypothetical protein
MTWQQLIEIFVCVKKLYLKCGVDCLILESAEKILVEGLPTKVVGVMYTYLFFSRLTLIDERN